MVSNKLFSKQLISLSVLIDSSHVAYIFFLKIFLHSLIFTVFYVILSAEQTTLSF